MIHLLELILKLRGMEVLDLEKEINDHLPRWPHFNKWETEGPDGLSNIPMVAQ